MLTIVGGGPGDPSLLTDMAMSYLNRAHRLFVEAEARPALGDHENWLAKAQGPFGNAGDAFLEDEVVWLVPGTPSLYGPVIQWLSSLSSENWQYIRIVPGVPHHTAALDQQGILLAESVINISDQKGTRGLTFRQGRWEGAQLSHRVPWQEARPLSGIRVVLLRGGAGVGRARRWFEDWGAVVEVYPVSRLADPPDFDAVDAAIRRIVRYDWVVFTSAEGIRRWFERLRHFGTDVRQMRARIGVVGPETSLALRELGLVPDLMPTLEYSQEGLVQAFREIPVRGVTVLLPGGQLNRNLLSDELRGRGALVDQVVLYQNVKTPVPLSLLQAVRNESIQALLFTASSQVEYLWDALSVEDRRHLTQIPAFSIGPLTTRTLLHYGISPAGESPEPSLRLLAEAVKDYYGRPKPH